MRLEGRESDRERRGGVRSSRDDDRCEGQGRVAEADKEEGAVLEREGWG